MPALAIEQTPSTVAADRREAGLVLRPLRGPSESPLIPLSSGRHVIGSGPDADVRLEIPGVEPQHAVLLVGPSRSVLKAFSRFTWVNDGVVRECVLKPGDRLCIGPLEFEVLKGKGRRREAAGRGRGARRESAQSILESIPEVAADLPAPVPVEHAVGRREQIIRELNGELLQQLSQLVARETVAQERERRLVEQSAQLEGRRRILDDRQSEIERTRAEIERAESEWRLKSIELQEQSSGIHREREQVARDRARLVDESRQVEQSIREFEERRGALERREAALQDLGARLEQRSAALCEQEQKHAAAMTQALSAAQSQADEARSLAEDRSDLTRQREQLAVEREQLQRERAAFEADRERLFAERAHLAAREVEITELRHQLHQQQSEQELQRTEAQSSLAVTDEITARETVLDRREQELAEQECLLLKERHELDERKRHIDEQHSQWMLERHTQAARESAAETRNARQAESDAEVEMLRGQITELQARLRDERMHWEMQRAELEAMQTEPEEALRHESAVDEQDLAAEIARLQLELEVERARFEQERSNWEAEQDLLIRDRKALEVEWRRLDALQEQAYGARERPGHESPAVPPPIPSQYLGPDAAASVEPLIDPGYADSEFQTETSPYEVAREFGEESQPADYAQYEEPGHGSLEREGSLPMSETADSLAGYEHHSGVVDDYGADDAACYEQADGGPTEVLSLRAQLAEMFGIERDALQGHQSPEAYQEDEGPQAAADEAEGQYADQESPELPGNASGAVESAPAAEQTDEEIMSSYLARLLKKTPEQAPAPVVAPVVEEPVSDHEEETQASDERPRPARRLNAEEKELLRANLDSFRNLANQQARAAVANHKSNEMKSDLQITSVIAALCAVIGVVLVSAELWSRQSYLSYGALCLAMAAGLGVYAFLNGMKIRKLKAAAAANAELSSALSEPEQESSEAAAN